MKARYTKLGYKHALPKIPKPVQWALANKMQLSDAHGFSINDHALACELLLWDIHPCTGACTGIEHHTLGSKHANVPSMLGEYLGYLANLACI